MCVMKVAGTDGVGVEVGRVCRLVACMCGARGKVTGKASEREGRMSGREGLRRWLRQLCGSGVVTRRLSGLQRRRQ